MKDLFTADDLLTDFLVYIEENTETCQEAKDYYNALPPDMTLGEAIAHVNADPAFEANWAAFCYLSFPKMVDKTSYDGFETLVDVHEETIDIINETPKHRRKEKVIKPREKIKKPKKVN